MTDLHHLSAAYALNALDADERRLFEAHYPTCEICSTEVDDFRQTAASLGASTFLAPPPHLKARVMAEVAQTRQLSPRLSNEVSDSAGRNLIDLGSRSRRRSGRVLLAAAGLAIVAGSAALVLRSNPSDSAAELFAAPDAVITRLDGPSGAVTVVWSPSIDRAVVVGTDLPDPGQGKIYQLWLLLDDGDVASGGVLDAADGTTAQTLDLVDLDAIGWGISIEPDGGSAEPTSDVLYSGLL